MLNLPSDIILIILIKQIFKVPIILKIFVSTSVLKVASSTLMQMNLPMSYDQLVYIILSYFILLKIFYFDTELYNAKKLLQGSES
jgi:hypothetical protein